MQLQVKIVGKLTQRERRALTATFGEPNEGDTLKSVSEDGLLDTLNAHVDTIVNSFNDPVVVRLAKLAEDKPASEVRKIIEQLKLIPDA